MAQQWFCILLYNRIYKDYGNLFLLNCPFWAYTYCNEMYADLSNNSIKYEIADTIIISILKIRRL